MFVMMMMKSPAAAQSLFRLAAVANGRRGKTVPAPPFASRAHGSCAFPPEEGGGETEYAVEMIGSTLRFGPGVTREIGYDVLGLRSKRPVVITDKGVANTVGFKETSASLAKRGIRFDVYDEVQVEPSERSVRHAIDFVRRQPYDCFIAVGGGSVIDTAKAAALYAAHPEADFFDFIQTPMGKGQLPTQQLAPLIAVPTTAGTGSETTGAAIIDLPEKQCKVGIRLRCIKPLLAVIDPLNVRSMPRNVAIYSGFDVLCHALESYTAKPYHRRTPRPERPELRPVYQGSNPISDVWVREALTIIRRFFRRAVADPEDAEARAAMMMAASFAGMGFGNAGVHLCHWLSYPISSQGKRFTDRDYPAQKPLIPHGLSVVCTAPSDFIYTAEADPKRHLEAAQLLGSDLNSTASVDQIGNTLADQLRGFMRDFGVPNGLSAMGFDRGHIEGLAGAAVNSFKANSTAPRDADLDALTAIYEQSMTVY